jgi:TolB protein
MLRRAAAAAAVAALVLAGCGGSSPKGHAALAFVSVKDGDYAIFGANADGSHARRLTGEKGDPSTPEGLFFQVQPAWSPDGTKLAFVSGRDGTPHVYVMNADGTGTRRLTNSDQEDEHPTWSADGARIVFSREGALFVILAAGGKARRLVPGLGSAKSPAYSPDGTALAYDYRKRGGPVREIWVQTCRDARGCFHQVTRLGAVSSLPAWSPDGKTIAFQSNARGGRYEIYTVQVDGTHLRQVTRSDTDVIQPAWTPDGAIGFVRDGAIWTIAGGQETQLTSGKDDDSAPTWRPAPPQ